MKKLITKNSPEKNVFSTRETILVSAMTLLVGLIIGILLNKTKIITKSSFSEDKYLNEFAKNYYYIIDNYYDKVDKQKLINGAISGMAESLGDPFSTYIDEDDSNTFNATLNGSYSGVGIQIAQDKDKNVIVTAVFKDSPAEKAGIVPGDKLLSVNDKTSKENDVSKLASEIRNAEDKNIKLKIERDGEEKDITVQRDRVILKSVKSETYDIDDKKVGYIFINIFASFSN